MTTTDIDRLERLLLAQQQALQLMAATMGTRLTREQTCQRLGVHRNTLTRWIADGDFPRPQRDGHFLLSEVMAWEQRTHNTKG